MKRQFFLFIVSSIFLILVACTQKGALSPVSGEKADSVAAPIINVEGKKIGEVTFIETGEGMTIDLFAEGLSPGEHGTHIHEKGECTPPDFKSAGEHFNPGGKEHGFENPKGYHLGDLPNIEVNEDGKVNVSIKVPGLTLKPDLENSLLDKDGSSLVIHEKADDYKTDPAGNSGDRIACAAITQK